MLKRHIGVVIGLAIAMLLATTTAATASPTRFSLNVAHGGGAGALAAATTGNLGWANRSVTLSDVRVYLAPGECGHIGVWGSQGDETIDFLIQMEEKYCGGYDGRWFIVGTITMDGSQVSGGITRITIKVFDDTHRISNSTYCYRSSSATTC
ncbi:hypothetical protein [Fodinicola acaciae]|uniref:hypothetical protein n=1 Tax=Fodinicola acaciae TaxID=2681555 RepID=UPI0013D50A35|nr:hypothetical protein [Fodinicola acaciae]